MGWADFFEDPLGVVKNTVSNLGITNPLGTPGPDNPIADAEMRKKAEGYFGTASNISGEDLQRQIQQQGDVSRSENVNAYNAAIAAQRGVNPTAAAMAMGQNLSSANAKSGAQTQALQSQAGYQTQVTNQQGQQTQQRALLDYYNTLMGGSASQRQADVANKGQNMGLLQGLVGGVASGAAGAMVASDERLKQPIGDGMDDYLHHHMMGLHEQRKEMESKGKTSTEDFMSSLRPQEYEYKPDRASSDGSKPHVGVMAQDLEKTPVGASAVMDTPEGKMVDTRQLSTMLAAAVGDLHQRLSAIEGRRHG
jgi:hypothetical protein